MVRLSFTLQLPEAACSPEIRAIGEESVSKEEILGQDLHRGDTNATKTEVTSSVRGGGWEVGGRGRNRMEEDLVISVLGGSFCFEQSGLLSGSRPVLRLGLTKGRNR